MNAGYKTVKSKLLVAALTLLMVFGNVASPLSGAFYVYGATPVDSWSGLENAIKNGDTDIEITKDLYADSTIEITSDSVEITSSNGSTIYQKERTDGSKYETMFKVSGGNLTLGENLTLSGKTHCGASDDGVDENAPIQTTTLKVFEEDGYALYIGLASAGSNAIGEQERGKEVTVEVYSDRTIKYKGNYLGQILVNADEGLYAYAFDESITADQAVKLATVGGGHGTDDNPVLPLKEGTSYRLQDGTKGYLGMDKEKGVIAPFTGLNDAYEVKAIKVQKYDGSGSGSGSGSNQGCDGPECPGENTYTSATFNGTIDNPKGFFVQVDGGTLNLTGATLENFITDGTVTNAAPVVVNNGTFKMSGGFIKSNSVGYTADNGMLNLPANVIGKEGQDGQFGDSGKLAEFKKTETAGAVILTNKSTGTITGGSIDDNRADTGAILVQGKPDKKASTENGNDVTSELFLNGGTISSNAGVHHAGAITIYNGGHVEMYNGATISENFSWDKGGAIWAREEVYGSNNNGKDIRTVGNATFIMEGGSIKGNSSINRAGAIEVMSNHVALRGGDITNNTSRVIGGAIYVEGDGPSRNYRLYIPKGNIAENKAVNPNETSELKRQLSTSSDCNKVNSFNNDAGNNIADKNDYNGHHGFGGGLWLCAVGGTAAITLEDNYDVYIGDNSGWAGRGKDIRIQTAFAGKANGVTVFKKGNNDFYVGNAPLKDGATYNGPLNGYNRDEETRVNTKESGGVNITGNIAAAGGGIASNGIVVFGMPKDVYTANAKLEVTKKWSAQINDKEPVTIKLFSKIDGERGEEISSVVLNGTKDTQASEDDKEIGQDQYGENDNAIESEPWIASFAVPLAIVVEDENADDNNNVDNNAEDNTVPLVLLDIEGETVDPSNPEHVLEKLKPAIDAGKTVTIKEWLVEVVEIGKDEKEIEYKLPNGEVQLAAPAINNEKDESIITADDTVVATFKTGNIDLPFSNTIGNDAEPAIEKYVNKAVHKWIDFKNSFDYDILAYVSMDADTVVITDQLVSALEFATTADKIEVVDLGEIANNHQVNNDIDGNATGNNGTVGNTGTPITGDAVKVSTDNNTLTVTLDDVIEVNEDAGTINRKYETVKGLRGHWVKVSFSAQLNEEWRTAIANGTKTIKDLAKEYKEIEAVKNSPVVSNQDHEGVDNTASYEIKVANESKYNETSNTVTVAPKENPIYIKKTDLGGKEIKDAKIKVTGPGFSEEWTSKDSKVGHKLELVDGDYVMEETVAPSGYQKVETKIYFTVKDGKVVKESLKAEETIADVTKIVELDKDGRLLLKNAPLEGPKIEKYVNPANADDEAINETVHTDLSAFDEVYRYDIQAYITNDASYVIVEDQLKSVLEFVSKDGNEAKAEDFTVVVKNAGENDAAPQLSSKDGERKLSAEEYSISFKDQKLVLEMGKDSKDAKKLDEALNGRFNGKWLQITFYAKIKDECRSLDEIKKDATVWFETADNREIDAPDNNKSEPLGKDGAHEGIVNDSNYTVRRAGFELENEAKVNVKSNEVTVTPPTKSIKIAKTWKIGSKTDWPEKTEVVFGVYEQKTVDGKIEETKLCEETLSANRKTAEIKDLPVLEGVTYVAREIKVIRDGKESDAVVYNDAMNAGNTIIGAINYIVTMVSNAANGEYTATNELVVKTTISKTDLGGTEIPNAEMKLTGNGKTIEWKSETEPKELSLAPGTYVLEETVAPEGYAQVNTKMTFEVKEDGSVKLTKVEVDGESADVDEEGKVNVDNGGRISVDENNHIILEDAPYRKISKQNLAGEEIDGAKMSLTFPDGSVKTWTSGEESGEFIATPGEYTLKEVVAPLGYEKVETEIKFTVDEHGNITMGEVTENGRVVNELADDGKTVVLKDAPFGPEIEKYVNQAVHKDIDLSETFTYDIIAYVTVDAGKVVIKDTLNEDLQFVSDAEAVKVADMGADDNHKPTNNAASVKINEDATVAAEGEAIDAEVSIDGQNLVVTIADAKAYRGHWVKVTFDAKIADGKKVTDLKYTTIKADEPEDRDAPNVGNAPVISDEDHTGVPNKAAYSIYVKNNASVSTDGDDTPDTPDTPDENPDETPEEPKHEDESNTVTVKPEEHDVKISKTDLEGEEIEGAHIVVKNDKGEVVEEWDSTTESHEIKLPEGKYSLTETVAPEGFNIVTTTIEFEVDHEGNVTLLTAEVDNGGKIELLDVDHIVLKDAPLTEVYFSKTDLEGEELEGAKMKLTDAEGNVIDEWTSTKEDHILKLADGEYILTEVVAPEGYQCVTTKMRFVVKEGVVTLLTAEVDNDGVIEVLAGNIIILKDAPEVQKEYEPKKPEEEKITPPTEEEKKLPPPEVKNVKKVDTGDNADIYIWIAIMIIAACAVTFGAIKRRRTN